MLKAVVKTLQHALVTGPGRPRAVPGAILGRPGHANSARESSKRISGPVPKHSRTVLESPPNKFGAASGVAHDHGTIFCYFCVVVRKPRYAFRINFNSVLLASHEVSSERVHAAKNVRILGISASRIEPGSV